MTNQKQRRLVVLSGDPGWCRTQAGLLTASCADSALWVTRDASLSARSVAPQRAIDLLGQETACVVFDAWSGFDVDAFGAISGTIRGGGTLILLTPPLDDWADRPDPSCTRFLSTPLTPAEARPCFLPRLVRLLRADTDAVLIGPDDPLPDCVCPSIARSETAIRPTPDQAGAVAAVRHVVSGHRHRPVVLIADRGRGKSAALGLAAAEALQAGHGPVLVTAPRMTAADAMFEYAHRAWPEGRLARGHLVHGDAEMRFIAPDELVRQMPEAALLLVDEAAAIPVSLLVKMLQRYARIAFATTVHGYEGTGRGFSVRFEQTLDRLTPGWRRVALMEPVRWAAGDPLERFVSRALLLDAEPLPDGQVETLSASDCRVERVDPHRLAEDDELLSQLFGLLVASHYRTRPMDLRFMLDAPDVRIHALSCEAGIVGAAITVDEGRLPATLAGPILKGERRVQGHLLPQSLMAHLGIGEAGAHRFRRVVRIAVHPVLQRRGLGRRLVERIADDGRSEGLDWLGASFGATPMLLRFWRQTGLAPVRLGLRREASTGEHAALMLRPLTDSATALMPALRQRFVDNMAHLLGDALQDLSPELVAVLLAGGPLPAGAGPDDEQLLQDCAGGNRGIEDSFAAIFRLVWRALLDGTVSEQLGEPGVQALVRRVVQKRPWPALVEEFGCAGRGEAERLVRTGIARLLVT